MEQQTKPIWVKGIFWGSAALSIAVQLTILVLIVLGVLWVYKRL